MGSSVVTSDIVVWALERVRDVVDDRGLDENYMICESHGSKDLIETFMLAQYWVGFSTRSHSEAQSHSFNGQLDETTGHRSLPKPALFIANS